LKKTIFFIFLILHIIFISNINYAQNDKGIRILSKDKKNRVALIIGNSNYKVSPLRNTINDANDMEWILSSLGFETIKHINVNHIEMERSVRLFREKINSADVGLFYFSGHGCQVDGQNYLIPIGERISSEIDVKYKSLPVGYLLDQMEKAKNPMNIIILDACRNNPFKGFRSYNKGFTVIDAPSGSFIAYATSPNSIANDGSIRNGIYTKYLLNELMRKDLPIEQVFKRVRINVKNETNQNQIPWESSSLTADFYFNPSKNLEMHRERNNHFAKVIVTVPKEHNDAVIYLNNSVIGVMEYKEIKVFEVAVDLKMLLQAKDGLDISEAYTLSLSPNSAEEIKFNFNYSDLKESEDDKNIYTEKFHYYYDWFDIDKTRYDLCPCVKQDDCDYEGPRGQHPLCLVRLIEDLNNDGHRDVIVTHYLTTKGELMESLYVVEPEKRAFVYVGSCYNCEITNELVNGWRVVKDNGYHYKTEKIYNGKEYREYE